MVRKLFIQTYDHSTVDNTTHARNKTTDQTYDLIYDNTEALFWVLNNYCFLPNSGGSQTNYKLIIWLEIVSHTDFRMALHLIGVSNLWLFSSLGLS